MGISRGAVGLLAMTLGGDLKRRRVVTFGVQEIGTVSGDIVTLNRYTHVQRGNGGVRINDGAFVAAGPTEREELPANAVVAGVPAEIKGYRE